MCVVLQRVRALVVDETCGKLSDGQQLRAIINVACREVGLDPTDLGLSFCASVDAMSMVGRTIGGSYSMDLDEVLRQRRELLAAKEEGCWLRLRAAWLDALVARATGRLRAFGFGLPRPKSYADAERFVDASRNANLARMVTRASCADERAWRSIAKRIAREVSMVVYALREENSVHRIHTKHQRQMHARELKRSATKQREELRRWWRDPRRTMEELLGRSAQYKMEREEHRVFDEGQRALAMGMTKMVAA